jgi:hypothetical protein
MKTDCHGNSQSWATVNHGQQSIMGNSQSWATAKCCPSVTMAAVSARHGSGQMLAICDYSRNISLLW